MTCRLKYGSLPFFRSIKASYWYPTKDGMDHYQNTIIAPDTMAELGKVSGVAIKSGVQ
jgi:hypothetical protein